MKKILGLAFLVMGLAPVVSAGVVEKTVTYKQGNTVLEGYLAAPDHVTGKVPAVLVAHEWMGLSDY